MLKLGKAVAVAVDEAFSLARSLGSQGLRLRLAFEKLLMI
jgi:hypothetical protein